MRERSRAPPGPGGPSLTIDAELGPVGSVPWTVISPGPAHVLIVPGPGADAPGSVAVDFVHSESAVRRCRSRTFACGASANFGRIGRRLAGARIRVPRAAAAPPRPAPTATTATTAIAAGSDGLDGRYDHDGPTAAVGSVSGPARRRARVEDLGRSGVAVGCSSVVIAKPPVTGAILGRAFGPTRRGRAWFRTLVMSLEAAGAWGVRRRPEAGQVRDGDLVGVGFDLEPATLVRAYSAGLFPMRFNGRRGPLGWWSPDPRGVLPLDGLRVSRSLRAARRRFVVTVDEDFDAVIAGCADSRRPGGWIGKDFRRAYSALAAVGVAHSVEVRDPADGSLVGGAVRGLHRRALQRRVDVPSKPGRLESRAGRAGRAAERGRVDAADCSTSSGRRRTCGRSARSIYLAPST